MAQQTGQCLCGSVTVIADVGDAIQACHWSQCRTWTGGSPYLCVRVSDLKVSGAEHIEGYRHSTWGERAFCKRCGTTLYWTMQGEAPHAVSVGLFADQAAMSVKEEIFVDYRAPWLPPFDGAGQSTEAEQIAKFDAWVARQGKSVE